MPMLGKTTKTTLRILLLTLFFPDINNAQNFPPDSPKTSMVQQIGLGNVSVNYSRPGVRGRKIFGGLVPFNKVWRTGANLPTFLVFNDSVYVEGKQHKLNPGKYALYTIPGTEEWTIIFSKDTTLWGAFGYKEKDDALRFNVKASSSRSLTENLTIEFNDLTDKTATMRLQWEYTIVSFRIQFDIDQRVLGYVKRSISNETQSDWSIYWMGAKYLLNNNLDMNLALLWINKSIEIKQWSTNMWTKAQILAAKGDYDSAIEAGKKAVLIGTAKENVQYFPYESIYEAEMNKWRTRKIEK
jgi:hypothetical protein